MNNAYIYKAKEINWRTSAKDEEKQYVTGNIVTVNNRYFIVNPEIVIDCGLTGLSFDSGFIEIDKDTIEPVIKPVIDKKKEVLIKVCSERILQLMKNLQLFVMHVIMIMIHYLNGIKNVKH